MKVEILEETDNSMRFILSEAHPSLANALRRIMVSEVPTLAIEDVTIIENTSSLYDEIIAHRLGLIPIRTDLDIMNLREECVCKGEGCPNCTLKLTLNSTGKDRIITVYSHDLKSEDERLKPIEGIPIIKLGKEQKLVLEAEAILGKGKDHAKWQPAVVGYKYYPAIEVNGECEDCKKCADVCPVNILESEDGKIKVIDEMKCTLCKSCVEACEKKIIKVRGDDKKFIFTLESTGALKPREILNKACEILEEKARELATLL
jgi:DNA-directed RNA polymerase subunit D